MDRMIFFVGHKRRSYPTLLSMIRGARGLRSVLVFIVSLTFLTPAAFGLGHSQTGQTGDFVVICTADGFSKVSLADETNKRPGSHCACVSSCAISCCTGANTLVGSFIGFSNPEHIRDNKTLRLGSSPERDGPPTRIIAIRAPPSF